MNGKKFRRFHLLSLCLLAWSLLISPAAADVTWNVDSGHSSVAIIPSYTFPGDGLYLPPVTLIGVAQTDPGTSGDPSLLHPTNSLTTSLGGSFKSTGSNFLTSINFGGLATTAAQLTITAADSGNWLPDLTGGTSSDDGSQATYGTPIPANMAATLVRTSPLSGYVMMGNDFVDASTIPTDVGRIAIFDLAGKPATPSGALVVSNGQFDLRNLRISDALGASLNLFEPINNFALGPGSFTQAQLITAQGRPGDTSNTFSSSSGPGTLSRNGAAYVLDLPFHGIEPDLSIVLDVTIHLRAVANLLPGDVNFDGLVNAADRAVIQAHLGQTDPHGLGVGDANGDGIVNANDFRLVPEPATLVSFTIGIALLFILRARR
ncbi:MAG TPA: dockerin type I repeat-containing protein [Pirellulales bacterium]|jgi:hypothetical protein